jgi:hypothetical protein
MARKKGDYVAAGRAFVRGTLLFRRIGESRGGSLAERGFALASAEALDVERAMINEMWSGAGLGPMPTGPEPPG